MSQEVNIPIPSYPPFTLRSSMVDRDPVIWVHLLENYIQLFGFLMDDNLQYLIVKSQQQLYQFLRRYLLETFDESSKIFSLGAINVDIQGNEKLLKQVIFQFIKNYSILKLNLVGESIWYFVGIYVEKNVTTVRALVDGTFKSKYNDNKKSGNISSIDSVHKYLDTLIMKGKFATKDLDILTALIGQSSSSKTTINLGTGKSERVVNKKRSIDFAERFVNKSWIEILERHYANGNGINAKVAKEVAIVSLISLPANQILKLARSLGLEGPSSLSLYPLFGLIIISPEFDDLITGTSEKVQFLIPTNIESIPAASEEDITTLTSIFPNLDAPKAKFILSEHDNDVEYVTNLLLENPQLIDEIEVPLSPPKAVAKPIQIREEERPRFASENFAPLATKAEGMKVNDKKLKDITKNAALRMIEDNDEPDLEDDILYKYYIPKESENHSPTHRSRIDNDTFYLYAMFQKFQNKPFLKSARGKKIRIHMEQKTSSLSDEIEQWLSDFFSDKEYREKFLRLYKLGYPDGLAVEYETDEDELSDISPQQEVKAKPVVKAPTNAPKTKEQEKKSQKQKSKTKASSANHNRKLAHNKKTKAQTAGMQQN